MRRLVEAVRRAAEDDAVGCIVLTGAGRGFCAGGDVKAIGKASEARVASAEPTRSSTETRTRWLRRSVEASRLLHEAPKPAIAMINGACAGAGLSLAAACDFRFAARSAKFRPAFTANGMPGDYGGSWLWTRILGTAKARQLYLIDEKRDAEAALAFGLVDRLYDDEALATETMALARQLAALPAGGLGLRQGQPQRRAHRRLRRLLGSRVAEHDAGAKRLGGGPPGGVMTGEPLTIPHLALAAAERWPHADAVVDGERRVSFAELAERVKAAAAAFVAAGLQPGERVGLWAQNSLEWIVACLGLQAAGGVLVPLNTRFKGSEVRYILDRAKAAMLVTVDEFLGQRYADMLDGLELPHLRRTIRLGTAGPQGWDAFLATADGPARAGAERRLAALTADAISDIMFTSGTTGDPKGAVATHEQTVRTARLWGGATTLGEGDRFLILWPFFHCSGYKAGWVVCLAVGATILPEATLEVGPLLAKVEREKVSFLPGPPTLFQTLLASPDFDRSALASVRVSVTGASSIAPSLIEAMRGELGIETVLTGYGLTESCGTLTMTRPGDAPEIVTTSCGRAIEGIELKLVDGDGRAVPAGEAGEVVARGMNVMLGYLDDPAATAEAIDAEGWLHTGDIGALNERRGQPEASPTGKKDMYIVGGFNCYPAEIEKMLLAHPAIFQVAVIGVPDERMGEVGKAYVVPKPGATLEAAELTAWSRERMANFKVPRQFEFMDALPTNATGKVQKFRLAS